MAALFIVSVLLSESAGHAYRAYVQGDTSMNSEFPMWPSKALVPIAFSFLWVRILVQALAFLRLFFRPTAEPIAIPIIKTVVQEAEDEIADAIGKPGGPGKKDDRDG